MKLLNRLKTAYLTHQQNKLQKKLDVAWSNENGYRLGQLAIKHSGKPALLSMFTPDDVALAFEAVADEEQSPLGISVAAAFIAQPEKLALVDTQDMVTSIQTAVSMGHVGPTLTKAITAFEGQSMHTRPLLRTGLRNGIADMMNWGELENIDVASALLTLTHSPLMQSAPYAPDYATTLTQGITQGVAMMVSLNNLKGAASILDRVKDIAAVERSDASAIYASFTAGVAQGFDELVTAKPQQARKAIAFLSTQHCLPELSAGVTERHVQKMARSILRAHDPKQQEERSDFADLQAEVSRLPHLAKAMSNMPESARLVAYTTEETGRGCAMVVEATPRAGIRITSGDSVHETPQQFIEAGAFYHNERNARGLACVFEAIAKLTRSTYRPAAAAATAEFEALKTRYKADWCERLPPSTCRRIDELLRVPKNKHSASIKRI